jgi:hypothetical protein
LLLYLDHQLTTRTTSTSKKEVKICRPPLPLTDLIVTTRDTGPNPRYRPRIPTDLTVTARDTGPPSLLLPTPPFLFFRWLIVVFVVELGSPTNNTNNINIKKRGKDLSIATAAAQPHFHYTRHRLYSALSPTSSDRPHCHCKRHQTTDPIPAVDHASFFLFLSLLIVVFVVVFGSPNSNANNININKKKI